MKYIFHHLGLGDHLVCNGLVRHLVKTEGYYTLFVYPHNKGSVKFMYRDLNNLLFTESNDAHAANTVRYANPSDVYLIGGIPAGHWEPSAKTAEESFYMQYNLPLSAKWDLFKCERDHEKEEALMNKFGLRGKDYAFIHSDNRFPLDPNKLPLTLQQVYPQSGATSSIFDYCKIIELAKEVHVVESSFAYMIDFLNLNKSTVAHRYARDIGDFGVPAYRSITNILT